MFRDARGLECDLLYENGNGIGAIEIKSSATVASDDALNRIARVLPQISGKVVVCGGAERHSRRDVVPLAGLRAVLERFERSAMR